MNPIDQLFTRLKAERKKAFIPFITAGDPDLDATAKLLRACAKRGASLIEVGFPYSDPIADGSVIQASYTRALGNGMTIDAIFGAMRALNEIQVPLVAMVTRRLLGSTPAALVSMGILASCWEFRYPIADDGLTSFVGLAMHVLQYE